MLWIVGKDRVIDHSSVFQVVSIDDTFVACPECSRDQLGRGELRGCLKCDRMNALWSGPSLAVVVACVETLTSVRYLRINLCLTSSGSLVIVGSRDR